MWIKILMVSVVAFACSNQSDSQINNEQMEEIIVKSESGNIVLKATLENSQLEGTCIWYNSASEIVAEGIFKDGKPYEGTFLNWSLYFENTTTDFSREAYCIDWVSQFEASFLSRKVDYSAVQEKYQNGIKQ